MTPQPPPIRRDGACVQDLVIQDLRDYCVVDLDAFIADVEARKAQGIQKYGTYLQAHNGRNAAQDAYEEALDLIQYLRQAIEEGYPFNVMYRDAIGLCWRLRQARNRP